jgi:hypothetical protein
MALPREMRSGGGAVLIATGVPARAMSILCAAGWSAEETAERKRFSAGHSTASICQSVRIRFRLRCDLFFELFFGLFFDERTFFVQKTLATEGAQERNFLVAQLFVVALETAFALRASGPKDFNHDAKTEVRSQKTEVRIKNKTYWGCY